MNYIFCEKQQLLYHQSLKAVQKQEEKNGFARYMDMNLQCITQKTTIQFIYTLIYSSAGTLLPSGRRTPSPDILVLLLVSLRSNMGDCTVTLVQPFLPRVFLSLCMKAWKGFNSFELMGNLSCSNR